MKAQAELHAKIEATHVTRRAVVYLRQSTMKQVHEHKESTARQYALQERAIELGWAPEDVDVIDEDLGQSGSGASWRTGFQRLAEDVARGRVGAIFALEVSRLARSSADWHRLLDLCGLADAVIADERTIYAPRDYNDRLLLGLHGTMSEAEQHWMRLRLEGGRLNKARRGEYHFRLPAGYEWDPATQRPRFDPDEQVQRAIRLVFERFRLDGSAYRTARYFAERGLQIPARDRSSQQVLWVPAGAQRVLAILHNPLYSGAYVYGRKEERRALVDGEVRRRHQRRFAQKDWKVCLRDRHPAYIDWDEYMANEEKLRSNRTGLGSAGPSGAGREGHALLQGLALCGRCGRRMSTHYTDGGPRAVYQCRPDIIRDRDGGLCWSVPARAIDREVEHIFLDAVSLPEVELSLEVLRTVEQQSSEVDRQWALRIERARYEARLAERRYKGVDPDNRVVARSLEREWNDKLVNLEVLEREREALRKQERLELTAEDQRQILALAKNLPAVWRADTTTHADRKNLLRMLIREVTLSPVEVPERQTWIQVLWQTGAVSDLVVPRPDIYSAQATSSSALIALHELVKTAQTDTEIADELNRRGLRTGYGRPWDTAAVRRLRYSQGLQRPTTSGRRTPDQREDGLYSVHGVARRLGVTPGQVRNWVTKGHLEPADGGGGPGSPLWFELDAKTTKALAERARRTKAARLGGIE
jgi:DNA invertase Pin-like site-specific DNA recombinase